VPYFTTDDGCRIFYTPYGVDSSDPVVIFLNGTTQTTWYWGSHVAGFKKRYGLLCYDARGQGQSDLGAMPISLKLHVSDLKNLLGYLAVERAHLVGISHGARLALEFSLEFPSLVDHLVLCSLSARTSDRCRAIVRSWLEILQLSDLEAMAWAALPTVFGNKFFKHHQKIIDKIVSAVVVRNNKKALIAQLDAVLRYPPPDNIPADFNIPTLLISGSQDPLVEPDDVRRLAHLCRARHEELAEIGHSIPAEAPQLFEKLVLEFLAGGHILANKKCAVEK
jgi:pimeloyl-ACP methyl ester carboxylesterase